jgi:hypothetical protein
MGLLIRGEKSFPQLTQLHFSKISSIPRAYNLINSHNGKSLALFSLFLPVSLDL